VSSPSDAPVREAGTRTRSGNAMLRTRAAILDAAAGCVERYGVRKTTMSDVASRGGVAKATLYNHFRTKDDVLAALVASQVAALGAQCAAVAAGRAPDGPAPAPGRGLAAALDYAAHRLGSSRPLRRVAADEPALLALLGTPGEGRLWDGVRDAVGAVLREAGAPTDRVSVDLVLRWVVAHAMWPGTPQEVALGARALEQALGEAPAAAPDGQVASPAPASPVEAAVEVAAAPAAPAGPVAAGVGWPG
jgi:AcrR family transcriptional regulator